MEVVLRATAIYIFIWIVLRSMGKRELAEVTPFEMVILVVMGDLIQNSVTQQDWSLMGAMLAISTMAVLAAGSSALGRRFNRVQKVLEGAPSIVINKGQVLTETLKRQRVPIDELLEAARKDGIADLSEVRLGILEEDGDFSFIKES